MSKFQTTSFIVLDLSDSDQKFYSKQYLNAGDLRDNIEKLESEEPKDKRKADYKEWINKLNFLYNMYNIKVGWKAYKTKEHEVRKRVRTKKDTGEQPKV